MIRHLTLVAFVALSACAVPIPVSGPGPIATPEPIPIPAPNPQSAKERFLSAAEANGCVVNEATAPAILSGATLSQAELARIMTEIQNEGSGGITPDQRGFRVTTGACAV